MALSIDFIVKKTMLWPDMIYYRSISTVYWRQLTAYLGRGLRSQMKMYLSCVTKYLPRFIIIVTHGTIFLLCVFFV